MCQYHKAYELSRPSQQAELLKGKGVSTWLYEQHIRKPKNRGKQEESGAAVSEENQQVDSEAESTSMENLYTDIEEDFSRSPNRQSNFVVEELLDLISATNDRMGIFSLYAQNIELYNSLTGRMYIPVYESVLPPGAEELD